jgi:hypothetical protein
MIPAHGAPPKRKLFTLTLALTMLSSGCVSMMGPADHVVEKIERERFAAMTRQDIVALDPMLAPDLTYCHSNGLCEDKIHFLETIQAGAIRYKEMKVEQMRSRPAGRNTYVLTGTVAVNGEQAGQPISMRIVYTDIYVNRDGSWRLLAWQSTRLP